MIPTAAVHLTREGETLKGTGTGDGPVDAVYKTIDRLIGGRHRLVGYAIKSITGGTDALGEVSVQVEADGRIVTGRGAHTDILVASAKAYIDAMNRILARRQAGRKSPAPQARRSRRVGTR